MAGSNVHPIRVLATCLAYVAMADGDVDPSERASMIAALSKWVRPGVLDQGQLQDMCKAAFDQAKSKPLEKFLTVIDGKVSKAQALSIISNVFDLMLADGRLTEGELKTMHAIADVLAVSKEDFDALRAVFLLKTNVDIYLEPTHRWNEDGYELPIKAINTAGYDR